MIPSPADPELSCSYYHESSQVMSYHSYHTFSSLAQDHWTHRIQAPLTYLQSSHNYPTSIPSYKLISTQRPRSTRSSSVVTLARPASSSSLKITDRSFRYASPCLWNQLPFSLRKPHSGTSSFISCSPIPSPITSSSSDSPLCTSITPSLFHSRLKTYLFHKSYPPLVSLLPPGLPRRTFACTVSSELLGFWFLFFSLFFVSGKCARLSWPSRQLLSARKSTVSYRIVTGDRPVLILITEHVVTCIISITFFACKLHCNHSRITVRTSPARMPVQDRSIDHWSIYV